MSVSEPILFDRGSLSLYLCARNLSGNMKKRLLSVIAVCGLLSPMAIAQAPGGITGNLQTWFDANQASGSPVVTWNNMGSNANVSALTSPNGGTMSSEDPKANYNDIIKCNGGYNGTFHAEVDNRTDVISGNQVTMYVAYQKRNFPDLAFNFHSSVQTIGSGASGNQWRAWGFRHAGLGSLFSNGTSYPYNNASQSQMSMNAAFAGLHGVANSKGGNTLNGNDMAYNNVGGFYNGSVKMEVSVGYWPGYGMKRGVMEAMLWDRALNDIERARVESYLAIKYGITLGINGTSENYVSPTNGNIIWDVTANAGYNHDIAGISRSDASGLNQTKSHSTNGAAAGIFTDILTVANGPNFGTPLAFSADDSHFLWGNNGAPALNTGAIVNYPTDAGELIETVFQRVWKASEVGTVGTVTLEFDMNDVPGVAVVPGANDLSQVRLLIDEDGDFSSGASALVPFSFDNTTNIVQFRHNFTAAGADPRGGFFFTLGSVDESVAPLPVELMVFNVLTEGCQNMITWSTATETNSDYFIIDRSMNMIDWEHVATVDGAGQSLEQIDYQYRDGEFTTNGIQYYRLTQVDFDGTKTILKVDGVNAFCEDNVAPIMYPNPAKEQFFIESSMVGKVIVQDLNGRIVKEEVIAEGVTTVNLLDVSKGTYMVVMHLNNGKLFTTPFVKL